MVDIGISQPVVLPPLPSPTSQAGQGSQTVIHPQPTQTTAPAIPSGNGNSSDQVAYDAQAVEQKRADAVKAASQDTFAVSDHEFTIFKDATGQYITRFTSLRDGKVTYIPEPNIFKLGNSGGSSSQPIVQIKA